MPNPKITLPTVLQVDDYHEVDNLNFHLKQIIKGVKVKEVSGIVEDSFFYAVVYEGKKPSNKDIRLMILRKFYKKEYMSGKNQP